MKALRSIVAIFLMALGATGLSYAACGMGATPTYDDILGLRYERTSCFGKCPSYQVLISGLGLYYVGYAYVEKQGTYEAPLGNTLLRARAVLRSHDFYAMNSGFRDQLKLVLDVPHYIVAVVRCGVTTKLDWPVLNDPPSEDRPDIRALFDDLDATVKASKWRKQSDSLESPLSLFATIP